ELAQLCRRVEATTKRNEKMAIISTFLKSIGPEEVPLATLFLAGKAFPESDPRVLEISYATISDAGKNLGQSRLTEHQLTIREVYDTLEKIAQTSGSKSRDRRLSLLQTIPTQTHAGRDGRRSSTSSGRAQGWNRFRVQVRRRENPDPQKRREGADLQQKVDGRIG